MQASFGPCWAGSQPASQPDSQASGDLAQASGDLAQASVSPPIVNTALLIMINENLGIQVSKQLITLIKRSLHRLFFSTPHIDRELEKSILV